MQLSASLNGRRPILIGLTGFLALIILASQWPINADKATIGKTTDQRGVAKRILAATHSGNGSTTTAMPVNGAGRQGSIARDNPLWAIPLASLTDTRQRPIFSPTRRPPPVAMLPTIQSPSSAQPLLVLVGAIAGADDGVAILLDETTKVVVRLKTGESHSGWTLQQVKAREVTMQKDLKTAILTLPGPPAK